MISNATKIEEKEDLDTIEEKAKKSTEEKEQKWKLKKIQELHEKRIALLKERIKEKEKEFDDNIARVSNLESKIIKKDERIKGLEFTLNTPPKKRKFSTPKSVKNVLKGIKGLFEKKNYNPSPVNSRKQFW